MANKFYSDILEDKKYKRTKGNDIIVSRKIVISVINHLITAFITLLCLGTIAVMMNTV